MTFSCKQVADQNQFWKRIFKDDQKYFSKHPNFLYPTPRALEYYVEYWYINVVKLLFEKVLARKSFDSKKLCNSGDLFGDGEDLINSLERC